MVNVSYAKRQNVSKYFMSGHPENFLLPLPILRIPGNSEMFLIWKKKAKPFINTALLLLNLYLNLKYEIVILEKMSHVTTYLSYLGCLE